MTRIALLAAGLLVTLVLAAPIGATSSVTKLTGTVGPGFTITLKKGAAKVKKLEPGTYKITTSTPFKGTKTVTVKLKEGTYKYLCDPHAAVMKGSFRVS